MDYEFYQQKLLYSFSLSFFNLPLIPFIISFLIFPSPNLSLASLLSLLFQSILKKEQKKIKFIY